MTGDKYADEYHIVFNANKTKCLVVRPANKKFSSGDDLKSFTIGGSSVEFVRSFVYLGHVISAKMDDELDVLSVRKYYKLFTHESNTFLLQNMPLKPLGQWGKQPQNPPLPLEARGPHLIHECLGDSTHHAKQQLNRFMHFCTTTQQHPH